MKQDASFSGCNDNADNLRIFAKSPFLYNTGMIYECANKKSDCTFEEISDMRVHGRLTDTDMSILDALYKYRFLNRYCLEKYLNGASKSLKKSLAKLVAHGIILRMYFTWNQELAPARTPSFYTLSKGTYSYYKKKNPFRLIIDSTTKGFDLPNEVGLLEKLVFNQFHIHFMERYRQYVVRETYYEKVSLKGYDFHIEGCFRLRITDETSLIKWFDLAVIPIRRNPFWEHEFVTKLSLLYAYSKKHPTKIKDPTVLVICEDDLQAKEAFSYKEANGQTRGIFTLYTSDVAMVTHDVLDWLYYCEYKSDLVAEEKSSAASSESTENFEPEPLSYDRLYGSDIDYDPLDNLSRSKTDTKKVYLSVRSINL